MNTPLKKTAAMLLVAFCIGSTACGPKVPSRSPSFSDSSGSSSQDTTFRRQTSTFKKTKLRRMPAATNDSSGSSSQDTTLIKN